MPPPHRDECSLRNDEKTGPTTSCCYVCPFFHSDRSEEIPYIHKCNLTEARARGLAVINTDSLGLRAKNVGASYGVKQPNEYRIALVGDSVTFGEGVPRTEDTFAQVLEDTL